MVPIDARDTDPRILGLLRYVFFIRIQGLQAIQRSTIQRSKHNARTYVCMFSMV